ncbi:YtxH domain-containing protein [Lacticaseibacillus daqingensis]|uniref:YtxH domain-containing protein n=1 Tax=Lacticaseibacillus daqingensis TaxID=2486014 RepID=UPI000F7A647F|nr:YtxH domain-containing protein [Lacticaseibacillus daqingensis]
MSKKSHFLLGFVLGAASSLAATYLLTPQTSEDLKRKFSEKKDDLADRAADYYDYARDATAEWRESAEDFVSDLKAKAQKPVEEADLTTFDEATAALKDELTDAPEVAVNDEFDDIVLDGKSAFAQAKDQDDAPAAPEAPATPEADAAPDAESDTPEA